ncbi:hypothetical protein [Pseudomonas putida]|uniref:hypothetical protein n=1 Tax=Pseudomonas putida TaxID=303 RepID=UPI0022DE30BA|nr:hypothetical protein [Pseudomonas putida]WBM45151.1 hypothetical protein M2J85_20855 [Pseudomonas putida]
MTILFGPQGTFGWFSYTTSRDTIELARLRAENAELKLEREILKKAAVFFAKESR